jgi:hypothetical protein
LRKNQIHFNVCFLSALVAPQRYLTLLLCRERVRPPFKWEPSFVLRVDRNFLPPR